MREMRGTQLQKLLDVEAFFMELYMRKIWKIQSLLDLYKCINVDEKGFAKALVEKDKYYCNLINIPKKNGYREICAIDKSCELYRIQRNLKRNFLDNIMISDIAYGFRKKCDYFDFLECHKSFYGTSNYLRIDISDFFGTISRDLLEETLEYYVVCSSTEEKEKIIESLLEILLYNGKLIQGTPVAPVVSNIILRTVDIRIQRYCDKQGIAYSRYVDDLLFSSEESKALNKDFCRTIERILKSKGFSINYDKLRKTQNCITLNGFVIDENIRLSRKKLKPVSRVLFYMERNRYERSADWAKKYNEEMSKYINEKNVLIEKEDDLINLLAGYRAFLICAVKHSDSENFTKRSGKIIERIEKQITFIEKEKAKTSLRA